MDCRAIEINEEMKLAAAQAIASVVTDEELSEQASLTTKSPNACAKPS
ncbi:NADP-dependent malic enzyme [Anoxybacillus flavithermus]|uniref:NADP-dependent malic enzyme n=1 Tax=Anoxybacillus flavithermus TaxID=33934 RepID=A0A178TLG9_9BACL|nr:NADP-dependent malic enzyme [Anoxybacillus flavithermus]OAO82866.1 NADP-dependent malic enzyme [Anoxybacillus flavithermus]